MTRAGVVHRDPGGADESGAEHVAGLGEEAVLILVEQAHDLAFGDEDAERPQQRHQPRHGHLPLMILGQHETAQLRPQRRDFELVVNVLEAVVEPRIGLEIMRPHNSRCRARAKRH